MSAGASADADRAATASQPSPQAVSGIAGIPSAEKLWRKASGAWSWLVTRFGPYTMIWIGAGVVHLSQGHFALLLVAAVIFSWAISLVYEHGRNRVGADYALSLATLMRDGYAEITVEQRHTYYADQATVAAVRAASAMSARSGETEGLAPQAASATAEGRDAQNTPEESS